MEIKNELKKILNKKEMEVMPRSYETVGDIIVLELPDELRKKEKKIGEIYLKTHKNVKTVLKKEKKHAGKYRTRKLKVIAGADRKETVYVESGCRFKVDLEKMYFSSRLAGERLRIAKQVKKEEDVLVMFSGAGPYCCVIGKHSKAKQIYGIEINTTAHKYAVENVKLNKLMNKISLFKGDVRKILPKLGKKFDRVIMPLPKTSVDFLPLALKYVRKKGVIHYYCFIRFENVGDELNKIKEIFKKEKRKYNIIRIVKAGQYAPYVWRVCVDIRVM